MCKKAKRKTRDTEATRESLRNLPPPDGEKVQRLFAQGKEARRKIEKRFESVRSVTEKDMQLLLS
jgi:hypothetical protein